MTPDQAKNTVMLFGKHKGKTLATVAEEDPKYVDFLADLTVYGPLGEAIPIVAKLYAREIEAAVNKEDDDDFGFRGDDD